MQNKEKSGSVVVIVVNYGTPELAVRAVESVLERDQGEHPVEIHLLDNASPGEDAAIFTQAHAEKNWGPRVVLWLEDENHGFGRGNNVVLHALAKRDEPPEFVLLLNPDAELENDAIAFLVEALRARPEAAAAGAGISFPDGSPAVAAFRFPSLLREIVGTINFGPLDRLLPQGRVALPPEWAEGPVDWVAGASVLMRFKHIQDIGFFDPDFFLYYEEVELMWRLRQAGHPTLYAPRARVLHIAGAATQVQSHDPTPKPKPAYLYASWRMYFQKTRGRSYALVTALLKLPAAWTGLVLSKLRRRKSNLPIRFSRDHWRHVVRPLLAGSSE